MLDRALQDADRLDALGSIGVARALLTGASLGSSIVHEDDPWAALRPLDDKKYIIDHFFTKLLRLPSLMLTEAGKREAVRRVAAMRTFLEQLGTELDMRLESVPDGAKR